MLNKKMDKEEFGAIGIGAMIVFIALILVAAVASAVIIQTAEKLQQNAQATGDDTQEEIAGKVQIHAAYYGDAGEGWDMVFSLAPGSGTVLDTAISWQLFCNYDDTGSNFGQDAGDFDDEAIIEMDGTALNGAGAADSLSAGTKYVIPIGDTAAIADCAPVDVNTDWSTNGGDGAIHLYIHVTGGGSTYEILDLSGSLSEGDSVL